MEADTEVRPIARAADWIPFGMFLCFLGLLSVSTFGGYLSTSFALRNGLDAVWIAKVLSLLFETSAVLACVLAGIRNGGRLVKLVPMPVILVFGWFLLSVAWSPFPSIAIARWLIGCSVFLALLFIHEELGSETSFSILKWFLTGVILVSFAAVFLDPSSVHDGMDEESLAGHWRGIFLHKNQAGCYAAIAVLIFLISLFGEQGSTYKRTGDLIMLVLSFYFLIRTHSTTSILSLAAAMAALILAAVGGRVSVYRVITTMLLSCVLLVLGGVIWAYWDTILDLLRDPRAFTGRAALWQVLWQKIEEAPLLGVGYGSFWDLGDQSPIGLYQGMWFSEVIQGHNGYLDIMLTTGAIGLALSVWAAFMMPVRRVFRHFEWRPRCHSLCIAAVAFFLVHNLMESTLFRQAQPLWVLFLATSLIIFGARTSHRPMKSSRLPGVRYA